jgi:hypothetical protein
VSRGHGWCAFRRFASPLFVREAFLLAVQQTSDANKNRAARMRHCEFGSPD